MSGPDGLNVPAQHQALNLGDKTVDKLIGEDFKLTLIGTNAIASGSVKTITQQWTEFDKKNNTGHFIPMLLPAECVGQKVTLKGAASDRTVTVDEDRLLVVRLENLTGTTLTVEMGDKTLMVVDFTGVIPVGAGAYDPEKTDFGGFGKSEDYVSGLSITWNGAKGKATGELKNFTGASTNGSVKAGRHFPLGLSSWYADGVPKKVNGKPLTDKDIIVKVTDKATPITVEYNGMTVLELDISGMTEGE